MINRFDVVPASVPMIPRLGLMWEKYALPSRESTLYVSPTCPPELAVTISNLPNANLSAIGHEELGSGGYARVYDSGHEGSVIKQFREPGTESGISDLSGFRANVALHTGLAEIDKSLGNRVQKLFGLIDYTYQAPEMLCALVPDPDVDRLPLWAMERIVADNPDTSLKLPNLSARKKVYSKAVQACGYRALDVFFDDDDRLRPRNMFVKSNKEHEPMTIIKYDVMALKTLDF